MKSINIYYTWKTSKLLERFLFIFWFCDTNNSTRVLSLQENNKYTQKQFSPTALSYLMLHSLCTHYVKADPKEMLLFYYVGPWLTAAEVESSYQYSITFCHHTTDGSIGTVWQNGIWDGHAYEAKLHHWIPPWEKNAPIDIH